MQMLRDYIIEINQFLGPHFIFQFYFSLRKTRLIKKYLKIQAGKNISTLDAILLEQLIQRTNEFASSENHRQLSVPCFGCSSNSYPQDPFISTTAHRPFGIIRKYDSRAILPY